MIGFTIRGITVTNDHIEGVVLDKVTIPQSVGMGRASALQVPGQQHGQQVLMPLTAYLVFNAEAGQIGCVPPHMIEAIAMPEQPTEQTLAAIALTDDV